MKQFIVKVPASYVIGHGWHGLIPGHAVMMGNRWVVYPAGYEEFTATAKQVAEWRVR